jgi:hypothetical protein
MYLPKEWPERLPDDRLCLVIEAIAKHVEDLEGQLIHWRGRLKAYHDEYHRRKAAHEVTSQ